MYSRYLRHWQREGGKKELINLRTEEEWKDTGEEGSGRAWGGWMKSLRGGGRMGRGGGIGLQGKRRARGRKVQIVRGSSLGRLRDTQYYSRTWGEGEKKRKIKTLKI